MALNLRAFLCMALVPLAATACSSGKDNSSPAPSTRATHSTADSPSAERIGAGQFSVELPPGWSQCPDPQGNVGVLGSVKNCSTTANTADFFNVLSQLCASNVESVKNNGTAVRVPQDVQRAIERVGGSQIVASEDRLGAELNVCTGDGNAMLLSTSGVPRPKDALPRLWAAAKSLEISGPAESSTPAAATSQPPSSSNLDPMSITFKAADGSTVRVRLALSGPYHGDAPAISAAFPSGVPCEADPERDAVFIGKMGIDNLTPDFSTTVSLPIASRAAANSTATARVGTPGGCFDENGANASGAARPAITADVGNTGWGTISIEFVVADAYSPSSPIGDRSVIAQNNPVINAYVGRPADLKQFSIVATSGPTGQRIQGSVPLRLDSFR
jgi:hypothetical protein